MKRILVSGAALLCVACGGKNDAAGNDKAAAAPVAPVAAPSEYNGDISGDLTWESGKTYTLKGPVALVSGKLTIQPGAVVKGEPGSVLIITKEAAIEAVGSASQPIVFTSASATPAPGDWGGVILLGKAPLNVPGGTGTFEDFPHRYVGQLAYGGQEAGHSCGSLSHVRIEFTGYALNPDGELNGLTLGGCGAGTRVDHVQVHRGNDDGVEIFGGSVSLNHILVTQPGDDGLDWDFGWTGRIQHLVVQMAEGRGDKAIEGDNNSILDEASPRSAPEIWNFTLVGPDKPGAQGGVQLRSGTGGKLQNGVIAGFPAFGIDIGDKATAAQFTSGGLTIQAVHVARGKVAGSNWPSGFEGEDGDGDGFNEATALRAGNRIDVDPKLTDSTNLGSPNFAPVEGSPALADCGAPPEGLDTSATHCGAIGTADWTTGWTAYP